MQAETFGQCRTYRTAWWQEGGEGEEAATRPDAPTKPPVDFHLVWRDNGRRPCTMWEPIPPRGYMCAPFSLTLPFCRGWSL